MQRPLEAPRALPDELLADDNDVDLGRQAGKPHAIGVAADNLHRVKGHPVLGVDAGVAVLGVDTGIAALGTGPFAGAGVDCDAGAATNGGFLRAASARSHAAASRAPRSSA